MNVCAMKLWFVSSIVGALIYLARSVPVEMRTCPNGWLTFEDSCYLFVDRLYVDWITASIHCETHHDAGLVEIESQTEDEMIIGHAKKLFKPCASGFPGASFWIGSTDHLEEGQWMWHSDRKPLSQGYSNWAPLEPGNDGNQDCAMLYGPFEFLWSSNKCDMRANAICERNITVTYTEVTELIG